MHHLRLMWICRYGYSSCTKPPDFHVFFISIKNILRKIRNAEPGPKFNGIKKEGFFSKPPVVQLDRMEPVHKNMWNRDTNTLEMVRTKNTTW